MSKAGPVDRDERRQPIRVLVVCPTRELANQAAMEAEKLLKFHASIGVQVVTGGTRLALEQKRMQANPCQVDEPSKHACSVSILSFSFSVLLSIILFSLPLATSLSLSSFYFYLSLLLSLFLFSSTSLSRSFPLSLPLCSSPFSISTTLHISLCLFFFPL